MGQKLPVHFDPSEESDNGAMAFGSYGVKRGRDSEAAPPDQPPKYAKICDEHLARHQKLIDDCQKRAQ
jgi:hypothetical protein